MHDNRIYLCAPINALLEGLYEEKIPFTEIKKHGDFGLGTFDNLEGEMLMLDGNIYQMTAGGRVAEVDDQALTPYACVTFYQPLTHDELQEELDYAEFLPWLQTLLPSPNIFYAIRIEGTFRHVEVMSEQQAVEYDDIEGTLAGFYTPAYLSSLSAAGLHLLFLSADRRHGGHLLSCRSGKVRASVQFINILEMALPMSFDYLTWDFQAK